ncbi:ABC transporter substrate-binding protein [Natronobacterium texcoconense]|uniref:ABC-type transport system, substrate-binding protein n=1 Tax=Natronobacterium texcoconense TaxID=1095778 RepID=A0A1H1FTN0_NATTX|nr:ABC transporter substrate-binding protein [Natronobacterium texcoconense]SDR04433.1 ABC-type transport system, substrate-binding protein [Natronobacterium texcoconense]
MPNNDMVRESATWSRRKWLQTVAASGAIGSVAGCLGVGDGGEDEYFVLPAVGNLEQAHFNLWSLDSQLFFETGLLWEELAYFSADASDWYPQFAEDWTFDTDGGTVTFDLREGLEWHDGTPLTADHAVDHFRLAEVWGDPIWDYATDVHAPGEHTLEFEIENVAEGLIEHVFLGDMFNRWIYTHPELHEEFIERAEDATTDDELADINEDLANFSIDGEEAIDAGLGNGPVELVEVTDSRIVMEPYDGYPIGWDDGNDMNWAGFEIVDFGEGESAFHEAAIADNIHGFTGDTPEEVRESMGDHWEIMTGPQEGFQTIQFSPDSAWGEDSEEGRALRQAIAYMYDPTEYVDIFGEEIMDYPDPNNVTGLNSPMDELWLDGIVDDFTNYGNSDTGWVQEDLAEEKMEEAGYERDGDSWVAADTGEELEVEILYPVDFAANVPSYENVVEQFDRFGITAEGIGEDFVTLETQIMAEHDFEIAIYTSGPASPHPASSYRNTMGDVSSPDTDRWNNQLSEVTVPWPPGDEDNDLETVDVDERIEAMNQAETDEEVEERVEELAWIYNQWVHGVQTCTEFRLNYVATDNWDWGVDMDDPRIRSEQPWMYLARTGHLHASDD